MPRIATAIGSGSAMTMPSSASISAGVPQPILHDRSEHVTAVARREDRLELVDDHRRFGDRVGGEQHRIEGARPDPRRERVGVEGAVHPG